MLAVGQEGPPPGADGGPRDAARDVTVHDASPPETAPAGTQDASAGGPSEQYACMQGPSWSWCNPSPTGATLDAVWGSAADDVWAVGSGGVAEHWNGTAWSVVPTPTTLELFSVWGSDANDVWAVGSNAHGIDSESAKAIILHWDGGPWRVSRVISSAALWSVWGSDAKHVWAVGESKPTSGLILFWDGSSWTTTLSTSASVLYGVAGTGPGDVWAVGDGYLTPDASTGVGEGSFVPEILHSTGNGWTVSFDNGGGSSTSLPTGVWAASTTDAWVATSGSPLHWNGQLWQSAPLPGTSTGPTAFSGSSSNDLWGTLGSAMVQWTGSSWQSSVPVAGIGSPGTESVTLNGVWASGQGEPWAVGAGGVIAQLGGTGWSSQSSMPELRSAWAISANDAWAVGVNGTAWNWNGSTWTPTTTGTTSTLTAVWAAASTDVWTLAQDSTVRRWGGSAWTTQSGAPAGPLVAIGGTSSTDVWVSNGPGNTGDAGTGPPTNMGQLFHFTGLGWQASQVPLGTATASWVEAIWAIDSGDVWAVGYQAEMNEFATTTAFVANWNGTAWSLVDTQLSTATSVATAYTSVWGTGSTDVWVAGSAAGEPEGGIAKTATVAHWDGVVWKDETLTGDLATLSGTGALWGSGPNDVWLWGHLAGSANESVFRWNGTMWSQSFILPDVWSYGNAITGTGPNDLWAVGSGGMILHHL